MEATVMLVDDDAAVLHALHRALRDLPYRVIVHDCAATALDRLADESVDVVVLDHNMPGMTGLELLRRLRVDHPCVVRVMLTGQADKNLVKRALNEGEVFRFLEKPVMRDDLQRIVAQAVARRRQLASQPPPPMRRDERLDKLSSREREIVLMIAKGYRVSQLAKSLFLSPHTVRNHLKSAYRKLGIHSQEAIIEAFSEREPPL